MLRRYQTVATEDKADAIRRVEAMRSAVPGKSAVAHSIVIDTITADLVRKNTESVRQVLANLDPEDPGNDSVQVVSGEIRVSVRVPVEDPEAEAKAVMRKLLGLD